MNLYSLIGVHKKQFWDRDSNFKIGFKKVSSWKIARKFMEITGCSLNDGLSVVVDLSPISLSNHQKKLLEDAGFEFMIETK